MTGGRGFLTVASSAGLTGCASSDEKIVDLSAGVFLVFVVLVLVKHMAPRIISTTLYVRLERLVRKHRNLVARSLYMTAVLLIAFGFIKGGLDRVHVFTGFVTGVVAAHVGGLVEPESAESRKRSVEIISLGAGVLFVLASLWYFGLGLFRNFMWPW